jgi:hypothetical protein
MRVSIVVFALLLLLVLGGREALWRIDHPSLQLPVSSPSGSQIVEVRSMPEGSKVPYGSGVFLQPRWAVLLSVQSELAFAGYCGIVGATWQAEQRLKIDCELLEGEPYVAGPALSGTAIEIALRRKLAANRPLHPTAFGVG